VSTFDPDTLRERLAALEEAMGAPGFWDEQQEAARISSEHARLSRRLDRYEELSGEAADLAELVGLASDDGELDEVEQSVLALRAQLDRLQEDSLFSGEYDPGGAVVSIHAGTGGTDAQDWAEILLRMYLRWADSRGFKTDLIEVSAGEEAGLKSATFTVEGENAFGTLKAERGVHRLVRLTCIQHAIQAGFACQCK
jgi:peptide chain release factor 2